VPDPDDMSAFAGEIQRLAAQGDFNPFALLSGKTSFHSVFLAPLTPTLIDNIKHFLADGGGPLASAVQSLQAQGLDAAAAREHARRMFQHAQGMCVAVLTADTGVVTVPQLFFGNLDQPWRDHAVQSVATAIPDQDGFSRALSSLAQQAANGRRWPALIAGPHAVPDKAVPGNAANNHTLAYWLELAAAVVASGPGSILAGPPERLADLAFWAGSAVIELMTAGAAVEADDLAAVVRCLLIGNAHVPAAGALAALAQFPDAVDDEELGELCQAFVDACLRARQPAAGAAWFAANRERMEKAGAPGYDLALMHFRCLAAAPAPAADLLAAAAVMFKHDRKSARNDLMREPLWAVLADDPGDLLDPLLDTAAAAELIGRSTSFIVKRLDQGSIPTVRRDGQLRLPKSALLAWKAVMDAHGLLS
jgi:hypothetical protein